MKNIFRLLCPCLFLVAALSSCYDEMDSKDSIDDQYTGTNAPVVSLTSASVVSFSSIDVSGTIDAKDNALLEVGVMLSTSNDFSAYDSYAAAEVGNTFSFPITGLNDNTTYYVRSYAVSEANGTAVSEVQTVTTPVAPIFGLEGTYTAKQYSFDTDAGTIALDDTYKVSIAFEAGSATKVNITNLFGGGKTISGTYNEAKSTITVSKGEVIADHPTYGEVIINPVNDEISGYIANATFTFQAKGGFLNSSIWAASVTAGNFGFYKVEMTHD